ncbi:glycoside hydrolase domain-containing protein [Saccharopolyspora shandongensis]|uniref:glycoside hydrolase domain-containing protein n=1 Tax=Saccharopolyspora shandongensis TaxID=418495 RepID=UPI0034071E8F
MRGLDYSTGPPSPSAAKAAGFDFVMRYVGTPGRWKNITAGEYRDMTGAGVGVALVFENRAGDALADRAAGARNARAALDDARSFGWPDDLPIYFAVDQDMTTESQMRTVVEYMRGAGDVLLSFQGQQRLPLVADTCRELRRCRYRAGGRLPSFDVICG